VDREPPLVASDMAFVGWLVAIVAVVLLLAVAFWVWRKGRPFAPGDVFRASRFSRGNRLFPTQVLITSASVVHYTPQWIGRREKSIHMAHVASVNIDTGVLFSDVVIETSGGEHPVACHGHRKGDAVQMKALIERHQGAYYRAQGGGRPPGGDVAVQ
jgi:predicted small integral membrane protein